MERAAQLEVVAVQSGDQKRYFYHAITMIEIHAILLNYIQNIHDLKFRKTINKLLIPLVKSDYP